MLVLVAVMKIGSVRMGVCSPVVSVDVAMLAFHRGHVHVLMMPVVVAVHVLVLHGRVGVLMPMGLGEVEVHAKPEQPTCEKRHEVPAPAHLDRHPRVARLVGPEERHRPQSKGEQGGGEGEQEGGQIGRAHV